MKSFFIRIFAVAALANSIFAFGASSPCKDDKPAPCSPPVVSSPQSTEDRHCDKQMKKEKEKKMKKHSNESKEDENYPGYGIFG